MITTQTARRFEVWTAPRAALGVRKAVLTRVSQAVATATLGADGALRVAMPLVEPTASEIIAHRILRVDESDTSFDEWRIDDVVKDAGTGIVTISAQPLYTLLGRRALVEQLDGLGTRRYNFDIVGLAPSAIIDAYVLPALASVGLTYVTRGTIDNDAPLDLTVEWDSPWALCRKLEAATGLELQLRRVGTTGYAIDLVTAIGSAAPIADVRFAKNLTASSLRNSTEQQATRVFPRGANVDGYAATMANARWRIANIAGDGITLEDPAGGEGPIAFDTQLETTYGSSLAIFSFDDDTATDRSLVGVNGILRNAPGFAVGKFGRALVLDGLNDYLERPYTADIKYLGGDMSLMAWINPTVGTDVGFIFARPWNGSGEYNYEVMWNANGSVSVRAFGTVSSGLFTTASTGWKAGEWHHLAVVFVGASKQFLVYLDGALVSTFTHTLTTWAPTAGDINAPLAIGTLYPYGDGWAGAASQAFGGMLDDVRIYNVPAPASGIARIIANPSFGAYLRKPDGSLTPVYSTTAATQVARVANPAGLAIGDLVGFAADANGSELTWLENPTDVLRDGVVVGTLDLADVPNTTNVIPNPALRTWYQNLALQSRTPSVAPWSGAASVAMNVNGVDGVANGAATVTDSDAAAFQNRIQQISIPADRQNVTATWWVGKDAVTTRFVLCRLALTGSAVAQQVDVALNTQTGAYALRGQVPIGLGSASVTLSASGLFWIVIITAQNNGANTTAQAEFYPAVGAGAVPTAAYSTAQTGSAVLGFLGVEMGATASAITSAIAAALTTTTAQIFLPSGWVAVGAPTIRKETGAGGLWETANASLRVIASAAGQGIITPSGKVRPSTAKPYGSAYARVKVLSGQVRTELVITTGTGTVVMPTTPAIASSEFLNQWESLGISGNDLNAIGAQSVQVRVVAHGGAATFLVDGAQHTETATQEPFVEGAGGTKLWQAANERLRLYGAPASEHRITLADLARINPTVWGTDSALTFGGRAQVTDPRILAGSYSTRIVTLERDYIVPGNTAVTLSTRPDDLQGVLARPVKASRIPVASTSDYGSEDVGPSLEVVAVPSAASYAITWTAPATPELSINGGAYSLATTNPLTVTRPAAGGTPLEYTYRLTINGQTVTDMVTVQPIDSDTVTPNLTVVPGTPTATQMPYMASATNPQTGAAIPLMTVRSHGTDFFQGASLRSPDTDYPFDASDTILVNRPVFGTTQQATVEFRAAIGSAVERIQRTVLNQVKTSFGPSLTVQGVASADSYTIYWSGPAGTLLSINGGATSAPPASPFVVPRPAPGTPSLEYCFISPTIDGVSEQDTISVQPKRDPAGWHILSNPQFISGLSRYNVYDNAASGRVSLILGGGPNAPNGSGKYMAVQVAAGSVPYTDIVPGLGGFYVGPAGAMSDDGGTRARDTYHRGSKITWRVRATIPVGYTLNFTSNTISGHVVTWLTSQAGVGGIFDYVFEEQFGLSGTFGSTGYFYLAGPTPSALLEWDVWLVDAIDPNAPPLDLSSPDLVVTPSSPTATQQQFSYSATDPTGGPAPTITVESIGTTMNGGTLGPGIEYSGPNPSTVTADRPPFGTTAQAAIIFRATGREGVVETIQRSIPNQVKTVFGPSLDVKANTTSTTTTITYVASGGTVELSIDGGAYSAAPASPIAVTRDANEHDYAFRITDTSSGQTIPAGVKVPALPPSSAAQLVQMNSCSFLVNSYTTDDFSVSWTDDGTIGSGHYEIWLGIDADAPYLADTQAAGSTTKVVSSGVDLVSVGGTTHSFSIFVRAVSSTGSFRGQSPTTVHNFNTNP